VGGWSLKCEVREKTYKSEGIVLKRINFGETDKIVTIFSKHYGKVTLLAKGIRRLTSRKRGNLEIFNQVAFFAAKGKGLDIVTEVELLKSFSSWRKDLPKVALAYQLCEMVDRLTVEGSEQEEVYELLISYLSNLSSVTPTNQNTFLNSFGINLLKLLGFWPKEKPFPTNLRVSVFIEGIIEKELKAKKFLNKL